MGSLLGQGRTPRSARGKRESMEEGVVTKTATGEEWGKKKNTYQVD